MGVLGRQPARVASAAFRAKHWRSLARTPWVYAEPSGAVDGLRRYVLDAGDYPWRPTLRTPAGPVSATLFGSEDVRTLNEIFARRDYGPGGQRVVVDIGANIGLATLFFATRRPDTQVFAAEPVPRNIERFVANTAGLPGAAERISLETRAVAPTSGEASFLIEETGRLGGLAEWSTRPGTAITVQCVAVADYLTEVLDRAGSVDLLKVDTEGSEQSIIAAIPGPLRRHVGAVVWENNDGTTRWSPAGRRGHGPIGRRIRRY